MVDALMQTEAVMAMNTASIGTIQSLAGLSDTLGLLIGSSVLHSLRVFAFWDAV